MTEREVIAHALLSEITGFGHRVGARARLSCADAMIAALSAAGYEINRKPVAPWAVDWSNVLPTVEK